MVAMTQAVDGIFGFDDVPAKKDFLSISSYINGLVGFIGTCPSPMTIAVQGNWGTGKTSAMLQIQEQLKAEQHGIETIFFNTWQYSQFDLGENLAISMLKAIADGLGKSQQDQKAAKLDDLKRLIFKAGRLYATKTVPALLEIAGMGIAGKALGAAAETATDMFDHNAEELDGVKILSSLRDAFEDAVSQSGRKLVVFVDDLDRLAPGRAIEVMEAIKVFLDVPRCVFVLAIDFEVVKLGVQEKYKESVSDRKARSFFDKIIQVPFHMPVGRYDMTPFFVDGLLRAGVETNAATFDQYMGLASASVGANPRSTKRLLNTFLLLKSILASEQPSQLDGGPQDSVVNYLHLFATLCLQTAFPEAYSALAENSGNGDPADELSPDTDSDQNEKFRRWGIPEDELGLMNRFFEELVSVFTIGSRFSNEDFNRAFSQSTITSVTSAKVSVGRFVRTFDRVERQRRSLEKRPKELVELALRFEEGFTSREDAFAAQSNPADWTMRMGQDQPRLGLLSIRPTDLKIGLEFKTSEISLEEVERKARWIEGVIASHQGSPADENSAQAMPQVRLVKQANKRYLVIEITKIRTLSQITQLAEALRPDYELAEVRV